MRGGEIVADRFAIERLAGSGGMGEVYRAMDRESGQLVAIKVLLRERHSDHVRFEREARILSSIVHPRVVRYVTHGVLPTGDPYLVMEWLEGNDLSARLERGPMSAADTVIMASGAAEALGALHEQGILHRDLKPSNLFLVGGRIARVKLLDLGIARTAASSKLTGTGTLLGTMGYMSPEQATATSDLDARADVFSLGCVMYECLTGEKAFDGANVMALLMKIVFQEAPRLREKRPDLPPSLCALVDRMLSKAPEDRPRDGNAVVRALQEFGDVPALQGDETIEYKPLQLTGSEQRAVGLIFVGRARASAGTSDEQLADEAAKYSGRFERLLDGSVAVMFSGTQVPTDLAAQAARCAIALKRHAGGRRIALTIGRREETGRIHVGLAIDRAAKLLDRINTEQVSNNHVMIDEATVGLLDARFDVLDDGGRFVLRAEREVADVRTLMGKPTPCVGRDRELRQIEEAFDECANESQARAMLLTAPAGMGKSRIGREIVQRLRTRENPPSVWIARGELLGAGSALSMLAELVRGACGIRIDEPLELRRDKLQQRVAEHVPEAQQKQITEFLGEIVGAHFPDAESVQLRAARQDAQIMSDQIRMAFVEFLRAECDSSPLCLLLEDLHWGDSATVRILDAALGELEEKPLFVLALGRPEVDNVFPQLWADRGLETKRLQQLGKKAGEQLARHVLGASAGAATIERIVRLADGNAFYLEELIRATAEGKGSDLPETVVAMVQSRLAALSDDQRRILRAASIFGETFWAGGVATLLGDAAGAPLVASVIRTLVQAELVTKKAESRFVEEIEYAFRHGLVREGAYAMLTEADSRLGHRLAGQWLEEHGETDALVLAGHFQKGGEGEKAAKFFLRVAEIAVASGGSDTAMAYARQALDCGPSEEVRIRIQGMLCEANSWRWVGTGIELEFARELLRTTPPGSKPWLQGFLRAEVVGLVGSEPNVERATEIFTSMCKVTPATDATSLFVLIAGVSAATLDLFGCVNLGDALAVKMREVAMEHPRDVLVGATYHGRMAARIIHSGRGNPWEAFHHAQTCRSLLKMITHRRMDALAAIAQGASQWVLAGGESGITDLVNPLLPDNELAFMGDVRNFVLVWHYANEGNFALARKMAENFAELVRGMRLRQARAHWFLGEVFRREGALDHADREIQLAQATALPNDQPGIYATLAALRLAQQRINDALEAAEKGMAVYEALDACSFFRDAFVRLVHAECLKAAQRHIGAKHAIDKAKAWLMQVAEGIEDESHRTTFLENVPENRRILELSAAWKA